MTTSARAAWSLDSRPPPGLLWAAALQHVGLGAVTLVFPLIVAEAAGADEAASANYIALAMIALGIATLLQAWGRFGIGSGFLLPAVFTAVYLPPAMLAAKAGGLGAVAGLTMAAGATQVALSFAVRRLRPYLPTELAGLVVMMIGLVLGLLGLRLMVGLGPGRADPLQDAPAGLVALVAIVAISVWGRPAWRPVAVLAGLGLGIAAHIAHALLAGQPLVAATPPPQWPSWPVAPISLPMSLLPGVLVGALACLVRASGDVVACQRANDPGWRRPDFGSIRRGVLADGLGAVVAGVIGVPGTNTYTASVGLSIATGVTARRVALAAGAIWIVLGLLPGAPTVVLAVPRAVLGAALFFAAAFIVVTGMGIIVQRLLDARRTIAVGAAMVIGLSYDAAPQIFVTLPDAARLLLTSSLVLGLLVGVVLTAAFRAGAVQERRYTWRPEAGHLALEEFALAAGSAWGARAEVIARLRGALEEAATALPGVMAPGTALEVVARFDEFSLDATLRWDGAALLAPAAPLAGVEAAAEEAVAGQLAALLLRRAADRVAEAGRGPGRHELRLHYDH